MEKYGKGWLYSLAIGKINISAFRYILMPFGNSVALWRIFTALCQEKSGNPS
jgi:hypothetical protein